jgi:hypothetical protein
VSFFCGGTISICGGIICTLERRVSTVALCLFAYP